MSSHDARLRRPIRVVGQGKALSIYTPSGELRPLRYTNVMLCVALVPEQVGTSLVADLPDGSWIDLDVDSFEVGGHAVEGNRSAIGDNSINVIVDGQLEEFEITGVRFISCASLIEHSEEVRAVSKGGSEVAGELGHLAPQSDDLSDGVYLTVGIPQDDFHDLLENCRAGRVHAVVVEGMAVTMSSASDAEVARDVVLSWGTSVPVWIDSLSFYVDLVKRPPRAPRLLK